MALAKLDTADQLERALEVYDLLKMVRDHELTSTTESLTKAMESLEKWIEAMEDELDLDEAEEAKAEIREHGTTPWEDVKSRLGLG